MPDTPPRRAAGRRAHDTSWRRPTRTGPPLCVPTRSPGSREQLLRRNEPNIAVARGVVEEPQQDAFHGHIDFPVVRGQTEVAAGAARFVERGGQFLERRAGNQAVAAKLGVIDVAKHVRIDQTIAFRAGGALPEALNAPPVAWSSPIPRAHRRPE